MNWEALGAIGEIVGAAAVVVTLGYLALQMRQNTAAIQTAIRQEVAASYRAVNRLFFEFGMSRAYAEGLRTYPNMPPDQRRLFSAFAQDHALTFQGAFALYESGHLEKDTYRAYLDWFAANLSTPGVRAWWEAWGRPFYVGRMVEAVDARLSRNDLPDILELPDLQPDDSPTAAQEAKASSKK